MLSTTKVKFIAATYCVCQCVWMRRILKQFGLLHSQGTTICCDNSLVIKLFKNPVLHGHTKHINVRFHFLRDLEKEGAVKLNHYGTESQLANIMTKTLKLDAFIKLHEEMRVYEDVN